MTPPAGLQAERTTLAWNRTAVALAANGLLVLRAGLQAGDVRLTGAAAVIGAATLALALVGRRRGRDLLAHSAAQAAAPPAVAMRLATAAVLLAALASGLAILANP